MDSINLEQIEGMIFIVRGQKVMLDTDLAKLYEVETKVFNRAVRRHSERFPEDFMFELTKHESDSLRCQSGTLKNQRGKHRKYLPLAFTEHGIAMLSGVLNSERAIRVNISVIRTFVKLRQIINQEFMSERIVQLEKGADQLFRVVFERLDTLDATLPILPEDRRKIGIR